jgi:hypothetical protein
MNDGWQRRLAYIEQPPQVDAATGLVSGGWTHLAYEPGSPLVPMRFPVQVRDVMPSRDDRVAANAVTVASRRTQVRMRWRDDITSAMRITLLGGTQRVMQIIGGPAEIEGQKRALELMCESLST